MFTTYRPIVCSMDTVDKSIHWSIELVSYRTGIQELWHNSDLHHDNKTITNQFKSIAGSMPITLTETRTCNAISLLLMLLLILVMRLKLSFFLVNQCWWIGQQLSKWDSAFFETHVCVLACVFEHVSGLHIVCSNVCNFTQGWAFM